MKDMESTPANTAGQAAARREEAIESLGAALRSGNQERIAAAEAEVRATEASLAETRRESGQTRSPEAEAKVAEAISELEL